MAYASEIAIPWQPAGHRAARVCEECGYPAARFVKAVCRDV
jgi:hypothetical protein